MVRTPQVKAYKENSKRKKDVADIKKKKQIKRLIKMGGKNEEDVVLIKKERESRKIEN